MDTQLKANLEKAITEWMAAECECGNWPDVYVYYDMGADMAEAASRVFDANLKGQLFAEDQG